MRIYIEPHKSRPPNRKLRLYFIHGDGGGRSGFIMLIHVLILELSIWKLVSILSEKERQEANLQASSKAS
jgi:hypothetical protein